MSNKKLAMLAAFAMAIMIASMPIVFAQGMINQVSINGENGYEGFAKRGDTLAINVSVQLPLTDLNTTPRVAIYWTPSVSMTIPASGCSKVTPAYNIWQCRTTKHLGDYEVSGNYVFYLLNPAYGSDKSHAYDNESKTILIDSIAPLVKPLVVSPDVTGITTPVTITYDVEDYANVFGDKSNCIGLKEIKFYDNGTQFLSVHEGLGRDVCNATGTVPYTFAANSKGDHKMCAEAIDVFDQTSGIVPGACDTVTVFDELPTRNNFTIVNAQTGKEIRFVNAASFAQFSVNVSVTLSSTTLILPYNVSADFSDIVSTSADASVKYKQASTKIGSTGNQTFVWFNVPMERIGSGASACAIKINSTDTVNNFKQEIIPCGINMDGTGPTYVAGSLYTTVIGSNITIPLDAETQLPLVGKNVSVHALFTDPDSSGQSGVGMSLANVYANFQPLGFPSMYAKHADNCARTADPSKWDCYWDLENVMESGRLNIVIRNDDTGPSSDDLGNRLTGSVNPEVYSSVNSPEIFNVTMKVATPQGAPKHENIAVQGDTVSFLFNVSRITGLFGYANFSSLNENAGSMFFQCNYNNDPGLCLASIRVTRSSGTANAPVSFGIYNGANRAPYNATVQLYRAINTTTPDFWTITDVTCKPNIDRYTATLIQGGARATCAITMHSDDDYASLASAEYFGGDSFQNCTINNRLLYKINSVNPAPDATTAYWSINLLPADFASINDITFSCPMQIYTKIRATEDGGQAGLTQKAEYENVTGKIEFFNSASGDLDAVYTKKLKNAVKAAEKYDKVMKYFRKIFDFSNKICNLRQAIWNLYGVYTFVYSIYGEITDGLAWFPPASAPMSAIHTGLCGTYEVASSSLKKFDTAFLEPFCAMINCRLTEDMVGDGLLGDIAKVIGGQTGTWGANESSITGTLDKQGLNNTQRIDVKDSIFLSIYSLCIPGIIYNLDKALQIQCDYAVCLGDKVKTDGIPIYMCKDTKARANCNYVLGQIFNSIPLATVWNYYTNLAKELVSNPRAALAFLFGIICQDFCATQPGSKWVYSLCALGKIGDIIGKVSGDLANKKSLTDFSTSGDACTTMEDNAKSWKI